MSSTVLSDCEKDLSGTAFLWLYGGALIVSLQSLQYSFEIRLNCDSTTPYNTMYYRCYKSFLAYITQLCSSQVYQLEHVIELKG